MFAEYRLPRKVMSDASTNFISQKFQEFCSKLKIHHAVSSQYNHQNSGQVEACITFVKCTMKKCCNKDVSLALLQIRSALIENGLQCPAKILFNRPIRGSSPKINTMQEIYDYRDKFYEALRQRQQWADMCETVKYTTFIPVGLALTVQRKDGASLTHGTVVEQSSKVHNSDPARYMS